MNESLNKTIQQAIVEAINPEAIVSIFQKQIQSTTESIARDMFSQWNTDFSKQLKEIMSEQLKINLSGISFAEYNHNIKVAIENQLKNEIRDTQLKMVQDVVDSIMLLSPKTIKLSEIEKEWVKYWLEEHSDSCSCYDGDDDDYFEHNSVEFFFGVDWYPSGSSGRRIEHLRARALESKNNYGRKMYEYNYEAQISIKEDGTATMLALTIEGERINDALVSIKNTYNKFQQLMLSMYLNKTVIELDYDNCRFAEEIEED